MNSVSNKDCPWTAALIYFFSMFQKQIQGQGDPLHEQDMFPKNLCPHNASQFAKWANANNMLQRAITLKLRKQELWLLCISLLLIEIYLMKFHVKTSKIIVFELWPRLKFRHTETDRPTPDKNYNVGSYCLKLSSKRTWQNKCFHSLTRACHRGACIPQSPPW